MRFFEDMVIGERNVIGSHTFTADEIKSFAARHDPQPFHLDEAAAARSPFGALCASGWHTASTWMRFAVLSRDREDALQAARGERVPQYGPSPGFRDLKWLRPVYAGDTITYAAQVREKRPLNSRPGWGLVHILNTGTNQNGELVLSFVGSGFIERRERPGS